MRGIKRSGGGTSGGGDRLASVSGQPRPGRLWWAQWGLWTDLENQHGESGFGANRTRVLPSEAGGTAGRVGRRETLRGVKGRAARSTGGPKAHREATAERKGAQDCWGHRRPRSEQTSAGGGGLGSGSHLQPPDRDLSWAALRCSPDLTQSFPKAAGRPFPGSAPRRPPDATGPTQKRPLPLPPSHVGQPGAPAGSGGEERAKVTC